jgi:osmotically-inducible protein OsmY
MSRLITLLFGAALGAAAKHFLDSASGARRRSQLRDQAVSTARSGASQAATTASHAAAKAKGAVATATPSMPGGSHRVEDADDVALARKVETEIFRDADAPKGQVSVDVQAGVVYLRGIVADESWIERLADDAKKVDGIKGVKSLLHRPGTPAPAAEPRGAVSERL